MIYRTSYLFILVVLGCFISLSTNPAWVSADSTIQRAQGVTSQPTTQRLKAATTRPSKSGTTTTRPTSQKVVRKPAPKRLLFCPTKGSVQWFRSSHWRRHFCLYPKSQLYRWRTYGYRDIWISFNDSHIVLFDHTGKLLWAEFVSHYYAYFQGVYRVPNNQSILYFSKARGGGKITHYTLFLFGVTPKNQVKRIKIYYRKTSAYPGRIRSKFWLYDSDNDGEKDLCLQTHYYDQHMFRKIVKLRKQQCFVWSPAGRVWKHKPLDPKAAQKYQLFSSRVSKHPKTRNLLERLAAFPHHESPAKLSIHTDRLGVHRHTWTPLIKNKSAKKNLQTMFDMTNPYQPLDLLDCLDHAYWLYGIKKGEVTISWVGGIDNRPSQLSVSKVKLPSFIYRDCILRQMKKNRKIRTPKGVRERWLLRWKK